MKKKRQESVLVLSNCKDKLHYNLDKNMSIDPCTDDVTVCLPHCRRMGNHCISAQLSEIHVQYPVTARSNAVNKP